MDSFNDNLKKYPKNKLVSFKDRNYSYSQGAFIADKIAKMLNDQGIGVQDSVAFLTERSEWYVFNILSILSVGAIYVPLDFNLPDERIEFILEDTGSKVLIVTDETYERAKNLSGKAIILNASDILKENIGEASHLNSICGNVACVLYTSGTTGTPKGINITRKSILNVCDWYVDKYGLNNGDVYGLFSSIGFDVASFNINVALYS
ncbi:AMP-binding protein [uncultured Methanobrevibacter sp.]|uniref:AMP-binding protein n=1 Tax=uncultured Methanobrevibacter sp. TaxID=253161 RepID=UPI0025F7FAEE|nr:AMP-binding protein [uncultured Methanobrevibacter sp.]